MNEPSYSDYSDFSDAPDNDDHLDWSEDGNGDGDHEPDPACDADNLDESDPAGSDESPITPAAERARDDRPRSHLHPPLVFPPLRRVWGPLHVLHAALKTDVATLLQRSGQPKLFLPG